MVKQKSYFDHQCELPASDVCLVEIPPYLPKIKKWFRLMGRYFAVDENHPRAKQFFRSYAGVMVEKRRHAYSHPSTIHPFSTAGLYRERIVCCYWLIVFIHDPVSTTFGSLKSVEEYAMLSMFLDCLLLVNLIVKVFTGFYDHSQKKIILSPKEIFKKKFFTYLLPEFICFVPIYRISRFIMKSNINDSRLTIINTIRFLRYLRLGECFHYLNNFLRDMNLPEKVYSWVLVMSINMYCILWLMCVLFHVNVMIYTYNGLPENSILRNRSPQGNIGSNIIKPEHCLIDTILTIMTITVCHFYGASEGYTPIDSVLDRILCSFILICGYAICIFDTAKLLQISMSSKISETKYEELIHQITEYAHLKMLPDSLKKRLNIYHEYKFQRRYFQEEIILSTLSEHLRNEVILYGCRNVLEKVPLFQGVMKGVIGSVLGYMKKEIYLPEAIVLKYGDPLTKMFFVSYGTLAVHYGPDSIEILHFEDGDHFGDLSITKQGGEAQLTIVALEITEVFTLSRKEVRHCTNFLKEMSDRVLKYSKYKYQLYSTLAQIMTSEDTQFNILSDLHKGRILEREHKRRRP